ncbi:HAD family hydrolase [Candidatus Mycoplasma pogonae]
MPKLFAFDLDGTLLNNQSLILSETLELIQQLKAQGHLFTIATGRGIASAKPILDQAPNFNFAVCNNGVVVKNLTTGEINVAGTLDRNILEALYHKALETNSQITISTEQEFYPIKPTDFALYDWIENQSKMDYDISAWKTWEQLQAALANGEKICQIALRNSIEEIEKLYQYFLPQINGKYASFITNSVYYDVNPLGADKSNGLKLLMQQLNLDPQDLVVFGDSGNDIKMLQLTNHSYCLSNGTEQAKAAAKHVIGNNDEPTIANILKTYLTTK